ncbi:MAG: Maf-like protein [uncultured bacterium]|nr:MAG: Maf-like protein [uncultured bacterium]
MNKSAGEYEGQFEFDRSVIIPENVLSPDEIEWCKREADLDNIQRDFLLESDLDPIGERIGLTILRELEEKLNSPTINLEDWVLASGSQFKKQILQEILPNINVAEPIGVEDPEYIEKKFYSSPDHRYRQEDIFRHWIPIEIAKDKAFRTFKDSFNKNGTRNNIVAVDTMVFAPNSQRKSIKREIYFQKPQTPEQAIEMIKLVSGKNITVVTGIVAVGERLKGFLKSIESKVETKIKVKSLSDDEIKRYVNENWDEVKNSTGGIDYTGVGSDFIFEIDGDKDNLKGLPQKEVFRCIAKLYVIQKEVMEQLNKING